MSLLRALTLMLLLGSSSASSSWQRGPPTESVQLWQLEQESVASVDPNIEFVQINPNSWNGIKEWLEKEAGGTTQVVCGQEHRLALAEMEAASLCARAIGWDISSAPAVTTAENGDGRHRSAGTLVAVAKHVGSELLCHFGKPDLSPPEAPGRLAARWVNLLGGIAVFSMYLKDGVGWNDTNRALAHQLLVAVKAVGCPWIVALDGNMTPSEFLDNESVQYMRGVMAAPKEGTCRFKDQWMCYDYFYIDERLQSLVVEVAVLKWWHTNPHKPVKLVLRTDRAGLVKLVQVLPKALPMQSPIGCARSPPSWPTLEAAAVPSDKLAENYAVVMQCLEQEVLERNDIVGEAALEFVGRGRPLSFRTVPVLPPRKRNVQSASVATQHLRWLTSTLTELGYLLVSVGRTGDTPPKHAQRVGLFKALDHRARWMYKDVIGHSEHRAAPMLDRWSSRIRALVARMWMRLDIEIVEVVFRYAVALGESADKAASFDRKYNHRLACLFYAKASEKAAGHLHRVTKVSRYVDPAPKGVQHQLTPDMIAQTKHKDWSRIWQTEDSEEQGLQRDWIAYKCTDADELGHISAEMVDDAAKKFREKTALKVDALHPRVIANASVDASQAVAQLLNQIEACEDWPAQISLIVYLLLPKPDGGDRPIGIPAGLVRLWERCRMPVMRKWLNTVHRDYDHAQVGCTSEGAVWIQLLENEALPSGGGPHHEGIVSILADVVKCFDRVKLRHVWRWGLHWLMPRKLLKMVLITFSMTRRLLVQSAYSGELDSITSIVPGSVFAIAVLHCMLLYPCDVMVQRWPSQKLRVSKYVDDITLAAKGRGAQAAVTAFEAFDWMHKFFMEELHLDLSLNSSDKQGKTVALASNTWLLKVAEPSLVARGITPVSLARNLGVDHRGAGLVAKRGKSCRTRRIAAALLRRSKLRKASRYGGAALKVATAGLLPAMRYGHKVLGSSKAVVTIMQRTVAEFLPGRHCGRSRQLRLAWSNRDPAPEVIAGPIAAWAAQVWDRTANVDTLRKAWQFQQTKFAKRPRWQLVEGPAGATRMQAVAVEWKWPAWHTFISRDGHLIDVRVVCPRDVKAMAMRDAENVAWAVWTQSEGRSALAPAPLIEPVQRWAKKNGFGPGPATAAQAFTAGMWTQSKAHAKGVEGAADDSCLACLRLGLTSPGTPRHRLTSCASTTEIRQELPWRWQHQCESSENRMLWERGLVANPACRYKFRAQPDEEQWETKFGADNLFTGDVATDGSRLGNWKELGRTGWAGVMLCDDSTQVSLAVWGPLRVDLPVQRTIARAELYAVWKVLVHSVPPIRLHVDCGLVVDGVAKGRKWCTHSSRPHADIWALVWSKLDDLGLCGDGVSVIKIAAHLSKQSKLGIGLPQLKLHIANEQADLRAKLGAEQGVNQFLAIIGQTVTNAADKIIGALDHISSLASAVIARDGKWTDATPPPRGVGDAAFKPPRLAAPVAQHVVRELVAGQPDWQQCGRCLRAVRGETELAALLMTQCVVHPTQRLAADTLSKYATSNGHPLWVTGPYLWCSRCGCSTQLCVRNLAKRCSGRVSAKWCMANLKAGRAPRAKVADAVLGVPVRLSVAHWFLRHYLPSGDEAQDDLRLALERPALLAAVLAEEGVVAVASVED